MPAGVASLVLQSQMIFTLLFGAVLLGERWQRHQPAALGLAGIGLLVLATQQQAGGMTLLGFVLTLGAAACWGLGNIVTRRISQSGPVDHRWWFGGSGAAVAVSGRFALVEGRAGCSRQPAASFDLECIGDWLSGTDRHHSRLCDLGATTATLSGRRGGAANASGPGSWLARCSSAAG